jgi:hypothetical protein
MNITPAQSQYLVTLTPGEAAVFTDGMDYPVLARMPDGTVRETATPGRDGFRGCDHRPALGQLRTALPASALYATPDAERAASR